MRIKVKTESGSIYEFFQDNERMMFRKGIRLCGEVVRINNGPISIGKPIDMDFHKEGMYGKLESYIMLTKTTPVTEIQVII